MEDVQTSWKGPAAVGVGVALFGTAGLFVDALRDLPFVALLAARFGVAAVVFGFLALYRWRSGAPWSPQRAFAGHYVALGVALVAVTTFYYSTILLIGMGLATVLLSMAPGFVVIANWAIWRMRPKPRVLVGIAVGFVGVVLIMGVDGSNANVAGIATGLASAAAVATWLIIGRDAAMKGSWGETQAAAGVIVAAILAVPVAAFVMTEPPSMGQVPWILGLGLIPGALAVTLLSRGLRSTDAMQASIMTYVEPVTALALGFLVLNESLTLQQILGATVVLAGMLTVSLNRRRLRRHQAREAITSLDERPERRPEPGAPAEAGGEPAGEQARS